MQRDVVLRWIEQIVATVRRMLLGPDAVDPAMAMPIIDEAIYQLLGPLALLVPRLDVPSAAALLRDPERILGLARLLELKAMALHADSRAEEAAEVRQRAQGFAHAANACPECGAMYPDSAHSCTERFQTLLALDHSRREPWGSRHGIVFSCYSLQHPLQQPPEVLERAWLVLHRLVAEGDDPARLFAGLRRHPGTVPADWDAPSLPPVPPAGGPYDVTIVDLGAFEAAGYAERVDDWARATYQRWRNGGTS
jgi:hypothetical protein